MAQTEVQDAKAELAQAQEALILSQDEVTAAQEQVQLREQALTRQTSLQKRGVSTAGALETAELALSSAKQIVLGKRAVLANAKARIANSEVALSRREINLAEAIRKVSDTTLTASFSGILSDVTAVQGGLVTVNERLGQLIDPDALEVIFQVSNAEFTRLNSVKDLANTMIEVIPNGTGQALSASIERVNAVVGEGKTGREFFATLQSDTLLRPGDFVAVKIKEPPLNNIAVIPTSAASPSGEVLTVSSDDRLKAVQTQILRKQGDNLIVTGPIDGLEIVMERAPQLGEGIRVKPLRKGAPPPPTDIEISDELRAKLVAFVESNARIPKNRKTNILKQLNKPKVPVAMIERLQSRMGS